MLGSAARRPSLAPGGVLAGPWVRNELWRRARAVPSLDLRFADNKSLVDATTGQNLISFTRASSGTYVDSQGVIRTATTNLLLRSEEFDNASWTKTGATITSNATTAPNGTITADALVEDTSTGAHNILQSASFVASTIYTVSLYAKAIDATRELRLFIPTGIFGSGNATFNLQTVTASSAGTVTSASITPLANGWYRCTATSSQAVSTGNGNITVQLLSAGNATYTGNGTSGVYLWGAQLEQSSTVGEYIPTTSTINSAPRFDHNPTTGESLGLLVEEQRTNLLLQSEDFSTTWAASLCVVTTNTQIAPSGAQAADTLTDQNGSTGSPFALQTVTLADSTTYTMSCYLKAGTKTTARVGIRAKDGSNVIASFDLSAGTTTVGNATASSIQAVGSGWYRCVAICASATGAISPRGLVFIDTVSYTANGTGTIHAWGAQLEAGAFPTSYIPTTTATATRSADVASISGSNFSGWYNQTNGSIYSSNKLYSVAANRAIACISDGTTNEEIVTYQSTQFFNLVNDGGVAQANSSGGTPSTNIDLQTSFGFAASNFQAYAQGVALLAQLAGTMPTPDRMTIGSRVNSSLYLNGTIRRLTYWPQRLPNSTLQSITQ